MDILTQALLGGAMAQTIAQPQEKRRATFIGMLAGVAADADILIRSSLDPLLTLEYHRQFTHALVFIPFGALIVAALLWILFRRSMVFARLYLFCLLGYSLSGLIDACTSYGTQLLWPFSEQRVAFNLISIVDPLFTGVLLFFVFAGVIKLQRHLALIGLFWCVSYLGIGVFQQQRVKNVVKDLASTRGHLVSSTIVKPAFGNLLLWRSVYISGDRIYVDGIRIGFSSELIYPGESVPRLDVKQAFPKLAHNSVLKDDIERFSEFSAGYIGLHPQHNNIVADIRYSLLPNRILPLWGIEIDDQQADEHARFVTFRQLTPALRKQFFAMLWANPLEPNPESLP